MMIILDVLSLLQAPFIQRAFIISIIIAVLSSILSIFIVLKKISLIGDGLVSYCIWRLSSRILP